MTYTYKVLLHLYLLRREKGSFIYTAIKTQCFIQWYIIDVYMSIPGALEEKEVTFKRSAV